MPRRKRAPRRAPKPRPRRHAAALGLSLRKFAELTSPPVSHTAVEKAVAAGRVSVVRDARGRPFIPDVGRALKEWAANRTQSSSASVVPTNGGSPDLGTLSQAEIRVKIERATALRLSNQQRQGRLIDRTAAAREAFEIARTVRDAILGVPDRVSAELAAETDQARVHQRLEEELRTALGALADTLEGDDAHGDDGAAVGDGDHGDSDAAH